MKEALDVKRKEAENDPGDSNWLELRSLDNQIFFYNLELHQLVWVSI